MSTDEPKMRIYVNADAKMSRGKYAAAAVHAALLALDVHPNVPVIVLGAHPDEIENLTVVVHDAGRTEVGRLRFTSAGSTGPSAGPLRS